eukprot:1182143-Karenia_brevis.AAC.1
MPKEERWGEDNLRWVTWAPWRKYEGDEEADGEVPEGVKDYGREGSRQSEDKGVKGDRVVYIETKSKVPR